MRELMYALADIADDHRRTETDRVDAALARDLIEGQEAYDVDHWPAARDFIVRTTARLIPAESILPTALGEPGEVEGEARSRHRAAFLERFPGATVGPGVLDLLYGFNE